MLDTCAHPGSQGTGRDMFDRGTGLVAAFVILRLFLRWWGLRRVHGQSNNRRNGHERDDHTGDNDRPLWSDTSLVHRLLGDAVWIRFQHPKCDAHDPGK